MLTKQPSFLRKMAEQITEPVGDPAEPAKADQQYEQ